MNADSEQTLRAFVEQAPVAMAMFDREMRYLAVSDRWLTNYKAADRDLVGRSHYEIVPDIPDRWREAHRRGLAGEELQADEDEFVRSTGSSQFDRWHLRPWRTEDGEIGGIIITTEDLTARVMAERALLQSQADLKRAQAIGKIGSWKVDLTSNELTLSEETLQLLGLPANLALTYSNLISLIHPDDAARVDAKWKACRYGEAYDIEYRIVVGRDVRWVHDRAELDLDPSGKWIGAFGTLQDITERKQIEIALKQSEERLRLALEAADMGVWEWDVPTGRLTWNAQHFRLLGYEPDSVVPSFETWAQRVHPDDLPRLLAEARAMNETPKEAFSQYRAFGRNGEVRWFETRGRYECVSAGPPKRYYGVLMDITERKRAEEKDRILTAEVNHRAKNLLAVVQAVAQQTARMDDPKEFSQNFEQRLAGLAASHDLLVQAEWRGVDTATLIRAQLAHFADLIGTRILLDGPTVLLKADAAQNLGMALHELGTNASKYGALSDPNGVINVGWSISGSNGQPKFEMCWREENGPVVRPPTRRGFGQVVMVDMLKYSLGAQVSMRYDPTGLVWHLQAPVDQVTQSPGTVPE